MGDRDAENTEISDLADEARSFMIPSKSREKYEKEYESFLQWKTAKGQIAVTEDVLLAYFSEKVI